MTEQQQTPRRRGPRPIGERPMTAVERARRYRRRHAATRLLRLPADAADRLTEAAERRGVDPGAVLADALAALATTERGGA